ncbi:ABC transporter substrate-binding protein [Marinovum sp.]|uniref:ABC transporter substrate-binding protein n=1 Tax=Marinovum sp. TaxID=2024839 RepID=UPI002B265610|nr:ABC transporter substrate-binding protein [Marinovum sp.]
MKTLSQVFLGTWLAVGVGLSSPVAAQSDEVCPKRGGTFRTVDMQYSRVDPTQAVNPVYLMDLVYDALLRVEHDLTISPGLAVDMPEQIDDLTFVFKLREGVKFHDGTDFNAEAVKFNVERQQSGDVVSPFTGIWQEFLSEVVVEDDHTVRFVLAKPWPGFLWEVASYLRFASPAKVEELGQDYGITGAAGTGPFMFETFDPKKSITLVRNPDYYRSGEPCVDRYESSLLASASVRILSLKSGELDLINTFPESQFPQFEGVDDIIIEEGVATTLTLLPLNTRHPALADVRVRNAIQHAIDGKAIIDNVYGGAGAEIESIFPPWHKGFVQAENVSAVRPDLEKARALLAEAGYGPNGKALKLKLMTGGGGAHVQRGILIQAQLKEIGIDLEVENKAYGQLVNDMFAGRYDMVLWQFNGDTSLKDFTWNLYSGNSSTNMTGYNKEGGFQNPRAQELAETIGQTEDPAAVQAEIAELQQLVFADTPFIFVNFRNHRAAYNDYVKGFQIPKLKGRDILHRVWLDK